MLTLEFYDKIMRVDECIENEDLITDALHDKSDVKIDVGTNASVYADIVNSYPRTIINIDNKKYIYMGNKVLVKYNGAYPCDALCKIFHYAYIDFEKIKIYESMKEALLSPRTFINAVSNYVMPRIIEYNGIDPEINNFDVYTKTKEFLKYYPIQNPNDIVTIAKYVVVDQFHTDTAKTYKAALAVDIRIIYDKLVDKLIL